MRGDFGSWLLLLLDYSGFWLFRLFLDLLLLGLLGFLFLLLLLWLFLLVFWFVGEEVSAHEGLQHLRYSQSSLSLVVLEDAAEGTFGGAKGSVQHVHVSLFCVLHSSKCTSFFFPPHLIPKFLDWKSVQFEQETSSR